MFPLFYVQIPKPLLLFLLSLKVQIEEKDAKINFSGNCFLSYFLKENETYPPLGGEMKQKLPSRL